MLLYLAHVLASNLYETMTRNVKLMDEDESYDTLVTLYDTIIDLLIWHLTLLHNKQLQTKLNRLYS